MAQVLPRLHVRAKDADEDAAVDMQVARLFAALKPFYLTLAAFGVIPTAVKSWPNAVLSFHPLRSTLVWALVVHAVGLASLMRVYKIAAMSLDLSNLIASTYNFPHLLAITHVSNYVILVAVWFEARRYKEVLNLASSLLRTLEGLGGLGADWPRRRTTAQAWVWVLAVAAFAPALTCTWQFWLAGIEGEVLRVPAHLLANFVIMAVAGGFCLVYRVIADVGELLARRFAQDISRELGVPELLRYRRAWLSLRALLAGAMVSPLSVTLCSAGLAVNNLLCMYHVLNSVLSGAPGLLCLGILAFSSQMCIIFVSMCCAADSAVRAVADFAKPLELLEPTTAYQQYVREAFRDVALEGPPSVCVGGFWNINRGTASSIFFVSLTYLIVLLDFRQGGPSKFLPNSCNCTSDG